MKLDTSTKKLTSEMIDYIVNDDWGSAGVVIECKDGNDHELSKKWKNIILKNQEDAELSKNLVSVLINHVKENEGAIDVIHRLSEIINKLKDLPLDDIITSIGNDIDNSMLDRVETMGKLITIKEQLEHVA